MKKILMICCLLFLVTGCKKEVERTGKDLIRQNWIEQKTKEDNLILYYELEEGRKIYSYLKKIVYLDENGKKHNLKNELKSKKTTMEDWIKNMEVYNASNDGGSVYFETKENFFETKFYLAWCNSLEANGGIKDIFIVQDKDKALKYCVIDNEEYYKN